MGALGHGPLDLLNPALSVTYLSHDSYDVQRFTMSDSEVTADYELVIPRHIMYSMLPLPALTDCCTHAWVPVQASH